MRRVERTTFHENEARLQRIFMAVGRPIWHGKVAHLAMCEQGEETCLLRGLGFRVNPG